MRSGESQTSFSTSGCDQQGSDSLSHLICSGQGSKLTLVHNSLKYYHKLFVSFPILSILKKYQNKPASKSVLMYQWGEGTGNENEKSQ